MKTIILTLLITLSFSFAGTASEHYENTKQSIKSKISTINAKLEGYGTKLKDQSSKYSYEAKKEMKLQYSKMLELKDDLADKFETAKDYSSEKWDQSKDKMEDIIDDIESRLDKSFN